MATHYFHCLTMISCSLNDIQCVSSENTSDLQSCTKPSVYFSVICNKKWNRKKLECPYQRKPGTLPGNSLALAEVNYWGWTTDSKLKRLPNVYDHCAVSAVGTRVVFHIPADNFTGFIIDKFFFEIIHFHILPILDLVRHRKFERLLIVLGHRAVTAGPKYAIFHILKKE